MRSFDRQRPMKAERVVSGVLKDITTADAIPSVYYANRLLDFRKRITSPQQDLRVPGVASEPSDADVGTAWRLIQEIEQAENTRLQDLDEKQAGKYVVALSKAVGQRTQTEYSISAKTKQDLVKKAMSSMMRITHGTIVMVKPGQGKGLPAKRRSHTADAVVGRPKKPRPAVLTETD